MGNIQHINRGKPRVEGFDELLGIAGEDLSLGQIVVRGSNNSFYAADIYRRDNAHKPLGFAKETAYLGYPLAIQVSKTISKSSWNLDRDLPVYLGDYGHATQIKPEYGSIQIVGIPYDADTLVIDIEPAIVGVGEYYEPELRIFQDQLAVSKNQYVTFSTTNVGYAQIEWMIFGNSVDNHTGALIGANIPSIEISSNMITTIGAKFRIKDTITQQWSCWSKILTADIM